MKHWIPSKELQNAKRLHSWSWMDQYQDGWPPVKLLQDCLIHAPISERFVDNYSNSIYDSLKVVIMQLCTDISYWMITLIYFAWNLGNLYHYYCMILILFPPHLVIWLSVVSLLSHDLKIMVTWFLYLSFAYVFSLV